MTKTTRNNIKKLLNINSKALQGLHTFAGYDFTKNYTCIYSKDNFTARTIAKLTGGEDATLLIKPASDWQKLHLVKFNAKSLTFKPLRVDSFSYWNYDLDYFFTKGDFETNRKGAAEYYFIVFQDSELKQPPKIQKSIDLTQRFKNINKSYRNTCYDTCIYNGVSYITTIYLQQLGGNSKIFEYNKHGRIIYSSVCKSNDINYYIDKSGYIVNIRREELQRRAQALRAKREKEKAQATDFSESETMIINHFINAKTIISEQVNKIESASDADLLKSKLNNLSLAFWHFENYKKEKAKEEFTSVKDVEERIDKIMDYLKKSVEG